MNLRQNLLALPLITMALISSPAAALEAEPVPKPGFVPPPAWFVEGENSKTAMFTVLWNGGCPPGTWPAWPQAAQAAFLYAVDIWASILNGPRTIVIDACWRTDLPSNQLGNASSNGYFQGFAGAPVGLTWYPMALANQLANADLNGGTSEIKANFNANTNWYFGTDGQVPAGRTDFVSTVLHEIGHGVGIDGSMEVDDGVSPDECTGVAGLGCWGIGTPNAMVNDLFAENGAGIRLLSFATNSTALEDELTSGALFCNSLAAVVVNGGRVPLYAPVVWNQGSSYVHIDQSFDGTPNALMTFSLAQQEAIHHPGPVVIAMLDDIGWETYWLGDVFVNVTGFEFEFGTLAYPFNTAREGTMAVHEGGNVFFLPGTYHEALSITRPMQLHSFGGDVTIGQ